MSFFLSASLSLNNVVNTFFPPPKPKVSAVSSVPTFLAIATVSEELDLICKDFPALFIDAVTFKPAPLIVSNISPIVLAELKVTVADAAPFIIFTSFKIMPFPHSKSGISVDAVKVAFKSNPVRVPFFFPKIPNSAAVVPPEISEMVNAFETTLFVSVNCKPLPFEVMDAVTFTDALFIFDINLPILSVGLTVIVAVFPALSEIEKEPSVIPIPPFKEDKFVFAVI